MNKHLNDYMNRKFVDMLIDDTEEGNFLKETLGDLSVRFREYVYSAYPKVGNLGLAAFVAMFYQDGFIYPERKRMSETDSTEWAKRRRMVFKRDNYTCVYCGAKGVAFEVDHKKPFIKGGNDEIDNLATSCIKCNRQKKDKTYEEFLEWRSNNGRKTEKAD